MITHLKTIDDTNFLSERSKYLQVMYDDTNKAIAKMDHLNNVWCRSRTNWTLANITVYAQGPDIWKRMRQISAEVESRRAAMTEAKWGLLRLQVDVDEAKAKLSAVTTVDESDIQLRRMMIDIGEKEDRIAAILRKFEGAMKDVRDLEAIYDHLSTEIGEVNDANVEDAEHRAHLSRAIAQSIRSVRICGRIDVGDQEYLEQCGVNPSAALKSIIDYVEIEKNSGIPDVSQLNAFRSQYAEHLLTKISK